MSKFSISPTGAFSCEWNKGIDRKASCPVKLVISMHAFLRALCFNYTVRISEVNDSFLENNSNHYNSLFGKEYRKKLIAIRSCFQSGEVDVSKEDRKILESVFLKDVEQAIEDGTLSKAYYLCEKSIDCIDLIKPKDCGRLFMMAYEYPNDQINKDWLMYQLLQTGHCDEELVNSLLDKKKNPMSFFLDNRHQLGVMYIIKHSATAVHLTGKGGCTPLMLFCSSKSTGKMEMLMDKGADINACDDKDMTALHYAASNHDLKTIKLLLNKKYGIRTDARNKEGMTALHLSVSVKNDEEMDENNGECSTLLVLKGNFDINAKDNNQRTPLHIACMERGGAGNDLIDSLLGLSNISLNDKDCDGCTPLHYAAARCRESVFSKLLKKEGVSISINAKDNVDNTPLHCAVDAYKTNMILPLLDAGANRKAKNIKGKTPLMIAKERRNKVMIGLLNNYKKPNNKNSHSTGKGSSGSDTNTDTDADAESKKRKRKDVK